jgi:hypothetical protein
MSRDLSAAGGQYIDWGTGSGLGFLGDFTYCVWVRYRTLASGIYKNVLGAHGGNGPNYAYFFSIDDDKSLRMFWSGSGGGQDVVSTVASAVAANTWCHLAFTRNASSKVAKFYFNGSQVGADVSYSANPDGVAGGALYTGADPFDPSNYFFDGLLAQEALWSEVLSAGQIAVMASGGGFPKTALGVAGFTPDSYRPLTGDPVAGPEFDQVSGLRGTVVGATAGASNPQLWSSLTRSARGRHSTYAGYSGAFGRGVFRSGYGSYAAAPRGRHRFTSAFQSSGRGAASHYNPYAAPGRGGHRVGYTPFGATGRGAHTRYQTLGHTARGGHRVGYTSFAGGGRGVHAILSGYGQTARGSFRFISLQVLASVRGGHRVANAALDRYELYRGVNAAADLTAGPWQTFTALPFTTPALAPFAEYHFVLRRRNAWGVLSQNLEETVLFVDAGGNLVSPPSPPEDPAAAPAAGGTVLITATYAYDADGAAQADAFLVYVRTDGTFPDTSLDTPAVVAMTKADGVAKLEYTTSAQAEGTTVKAIVRTRRTGTPSVDSTNVDPFVSAVATLLGPPTVTPAAVLQGTLLEQAQTS